MKQRILSFVLAVIMVALAIPTVLLPVVAAENRQSFTTKLEVGGENWPVAVTDDGDSYYPEYRNGWSVGKYDSGIYYEFDEVRKFNGKPAHLIHSKTGTEWGKNGMFLYLAEGKPTLLAAVEQQFGTNFPEYDKDGNLLWDGVLPDSADGFCGPGPYYKVIDERSGNYLNTYAFVYTYTAPYEGAIDINIRDIVMSNTSTTREPATSQMGEKKAYFSIYINDVMIWPTEGGSITNPNDWAIYPQVDANGEKVTDIVDVLKDIEINVGDTVRFAVARYNCQHAKFVPEIVYHDDYNIAPSKLTATFDSSAATWPTIRKAPGISALKQKDLNWTFGQFDSDTQTFAPFARMKKDKTETWACTGNDPSYTDNNGILLDSAYKETVGALMVGAKETNLRPAYQYSAIATGVASMELGAGFMLIDENSEAAKNASGTITVYKNGALIGTITVTSDASGVATATAAITGIELTKKDTVLFVATELSGGAVQILANPTVQYTSILSFIDADVTDKYVLAMDAASIIVGDKIALSFAAYATRDVYQDAEAVKLRIWDSTVEGEKTKDNAVAEIAMTADVTGDYAYSCIYDECAPKQMTDAVTVQAYAVIDGEEYVSASQTVSLASVAYAQFEKAVAAEEEKQAKLMAAVLNYGAAAQEYFAYNVDDLANKDLPEEWKVIDKKEDGYYSAAIMDSLDPGVGNYAYSEITAVALVFESTIGIRVYVDVAPGEKDKPIYMRTGLSDADLTGRGETVDEGYAFTVSDIGLNDLKTTYYFQTVVEYSKKVGDKLYPVSWFGNIFTYSVEAYVARMAYDAEEPELSNLLHALMNLSDAAAAV